MTESDDNILLEIAWGRLILASIPISVAKISVGKLVCGVPGFLFDHMCSIFA